MMTDLAIQPAPTGQSTPSKLSDYFALTKPEVNMLILMTTATGYLLGRTVALDSRKLLCTLIGTLLVASGTATLNQFLERVHDARMRRTAARPLPSKRLRPQEALCFGILLSVAGSLLLLLTVNALAASLAIATLAAYLLIYTPLKRTTPICTAIGAIPGAMPTLIGWAGAAGFLDLRAGLLFVILFLWQFPHFLAIALMYREDYERAGYKMLPLFDGEGRFTRAEILGFSMILTIVTVAYVANETRAIFPLAVMAVFGAFLLAQCLRLVRLGSRAEAKRLVHASVIYLPGVLAVLVGHKLWT
jgi:heme o synthase